MIQLLFLTVYIILFSGSSLAENNEPSASLNKLIDEIVKNVALSGEDIGLEPLRIPDIHQEKEQNGAVQVFNLTEGELKNVKTITRFGDAEVSYKSGTLNVKVGFQFSELEDPEELFQKSTALYLEDLGLKKEELRKMCISLLKASIKIGNFNFDMTTWGLNPNGHLTAIFPDLAVFVDASVDPINFKATLNKLLIPSVGDLKVSINTSKPIYGMIMESLIDSLTLFLQDEIVYILGKVITTKMNELIVYYEQLIDMN